LTGRHAIASILEERGEYDLSLASNGRDALSLAAEIQPDVILLDVMMPDLDGYEVCRQIRSDPELGEIPILMVTSLNEREDRLKGIASGADDFISKPFDPLELSIKIRTITRLDRFRKLREQNHQLTSIKRDLHELEHKKAHLHKLAMVDDLTQLHNRRSLLLKGRSEFERAQRYKVDLSALMIDVDKFKNVNDTFGHQAGSFILKTVAVEFNNNLRTLDIAGRFGGDEFLILLPHTPLTSARWLADRLRRTIDFRNFRIKDNLVHITISVGLATLSDSMKNLDDLIEAADIALYKAKATRNTVA